MMLRIRSPSREFRILHGSVEQPGGGEKRREWVWCVVWAHRYKTQREGEKEGPRVPDTASTLVG